MPEAATADGGAAPATAAGGTTTAAAPAATGAAAAPATVLGGAGTVGTETPSWHATLPPDIAAKPWVKTHKTSESFFKSVEEAQGLIGRSIQIPKAGEGRDAWERVWNKMGRPETVEGYKIADLKLPEGVKLPAALTDGYTQFAHDIGLSNWQANKIAEHIGTRIANEISTPAGHADAKVAEQTLKTAWGGAYEKNLTLAQRAIQYAGGDKLQAALRATGAANNPDIAIAFARLGAFLAEDGVISGEGPVGVATAKSDLNAILDNKDHPYWKKNAPGHKDAMAEVARLNQLLHGKP